MTRSVHVELIYFFFGVVRLFFFEELADDEPEDAALRLRVAEAVNDTRLRPGASVATGVFDEDAIKRGGVYSL